ncbi:MAG: hypothetical protein QXY22_02935 [Candidatus Nitrosotenuis sp.]
MANPLFSFYGGSKLLRELCLKTLLIVMALCIIVLGNLVLTHAQSTTEPIVVISPAMVEPGEKSHKIGYVSLAGKQGTLGKATHDTIVKLESENTSIATVPQEVIIPAGSQYTVFDVKTTGIPGTTNIFASVGNELSLATLTVGGQSDDLTSDLKMIVNLPTPEMSVNSEMPFSLYLQNSDGTIAQAPYDIPITLDYEKNLVTVEITEQSIKKGNSYVLGTIKSKEKVGNAFIRASADKLGFDEAKEIRISSSLPSSLAVNIFPEKIPATLKRDIDIIVSLVDSDGLPTFAQEDIKLQFFSDDQSINDQIDRAAKELNLSQTIKKGEFSYHFKQRLDLAKEGKTITVGATTKGLGVAMDSFQTVKPLTTSNPLVVNKTMQIFTLDKVPTKSKTIAVYQIGTLYVASDSENSTETKEGEFLPLIVNENYDSIGSDHKIGLISSNNLLLKVNSVGKMDVSSSHGTAQIETGQETGSVVLASTIKGIGAASTTTEVINTLKQEKSMIFSPTGDKSILFDKNGYFDVFIISLDSKNRPTAVENEIRYLVTPINEILTIPKGKTYSHVSFLGNLIQSDVKEPITIRTVPIGESADPGLQSQHVFAREPTAKLAISVPFDILSPEKTEYSGIIQVLDFYDNPISVTEDIRVKITPSEFGFLGIPDYIIVPKGASFTSFPIQTNEKAGSVTIKASAKGILGAQTQVDTKSAITKLKISLGSVSEPLLAEQPAELKIYVDDEEQKSVNGATLKIVSNGATVIPETIKTNEEGYAIVQINAKQPPKISLQILATAEGFTGEQKSVSFDVTQTTQENKTELPEWITYAGAGGVAVIGLGIFFALRKPKKIEEDESYE